MYWTWHNRIRYSGTATEGSGGSAAPSPGAAAGTDNTAAGNTNDNAAAGGDAGDGTGGTSTDNTPPWVKRRLGQLSANYQDVKTQLELRERELAELRAAAQSGNNGNSTADGNGTGTGNGGAFSAADLDRMVAEKVAQTRFVDKCNELHNNGVTQFKDFSTKMEQFKQLGGLPPSVLEAVTELPDGHAILYKLADDLDETSRIMSLSPVRQAAALAKLGIAPTPKLVPSTGNNVPPPPNVRLGGNSGSGGKINLYDPKIDSKTWLAERQKERLANPRRGRR